MTEGDANAIIKKVAERLSFFFSDANLRSDRFMRREVMEKDDSDGFVTINILLKFNTIKSITDDPKIIAKAVNEVKNPPLKLNDDESAIARVEPFTQDMMEGNVKVTLRVSNIPTKEGEDGEDYDVSRDEITALFQEFGDVAMVRLLKSKMRGQDNKVAVGRGFVEFCTVEDMEKAVAELCTENIEDESLKPNKVLTIKGNDLRVKTMQQWLDKKKDQRKEKSSKSPMTEKNKRKAEKVEEEKEKIESIEFKLDWKPGCVISVKGLPEDCDREAILTAVKGFMGDDVVVRADYSRGLKDGAIRFDEPTERIAALAADLKEGKVTVNGQTVESASVLEGEEETKYYEDYISFRTKQMQAAAEEKQKRKKRRGRA